MTLFGIVTYKEKFWETDSFTSLIESFYHNSCGVDEINIFIFDNTDEKNWKLVPPEFFNSIKITYIHDVKNSGISSAYNQIANHAKENNFQWIVFLDQDSKLPLKSHYVYKNFANGNKKGIAAPKVFSNDKLISPSKYFLLRNFLYDDITEEKIELKGNSCINSGLMIAVETFYSVGGYEQKLRLDLCDHEFISRLTKKTRYLYILNYNLQQDFSAETNSLEKAIFRYGLYCKDVEEFKKINKNYLLSLISIDLPHLLKLTLQYKTFEFFKIRFR